MARCRAIPIADELPQRHLWALINLTQTVTAVYSFALMWMPGLAAILTCRVLGVRCARSASGSSDSARFPNTDFVRRLAGAPDWVVIAMFVILTGTTGMLSGVAAATGVALLSG